MSSHDDTYGYDDAYGDDGGAYGYDETQEIVAPTINPITVTRVVNIFLIGLFFIAIVLHVVCLSVMAAKHNEIVDKFSDANPDIRKHCILFVDYNGKSVNNKCHIVVYGSAGLGGCALMMIVFLLIRTLLFRK